MDEEGGVGVNYLGNMTDDGSISSKQRLQLLKQMYYQCLSDYRAYLEEEHSKEKDATKRESLIEQEMAIYHANIGNRFFPQIAALEKKVIQEEKDEKRAQIKATKKQKDDDRKKAEEKKKKEEEDKKAEEEKKAEEQRLEEQQAEENQSEEEQKTMEQTSNEQEEKASDGQEAEDPANPRAQQLMNQFDNELSENGLNTDEIKEEFKGKDLDDLNDAEKNRLSELVFKGMRFAIDKSEANHNPGWLLLYLAKIYPTLAQRLPPHSLYNISRMIMDDYLTKRYGIHYANVPAQYKDLSSEKFKDRPIKEKMLLAQGIVAREMSSGYVSKQNSAPGTIITLLNAVPFDEIERGSDEKIIIPEETTEKQEEIPEEFPIVYEEVKQAVEPVEEVKEPVVEAFEETKPSEEIPITYEPSIITQEPVEIPVLDNDDNNINKKVEPIEPHIESLVLNEKENKTEAQNAYDINSSMDEPDEQSDFFDPFNLNKTTQKQLNKTDIYDRFDKAVNKSEPKQHPVIYYTNLETPYVVPEEQLNQFGQFMLYTQKNKLTHTKIEKQLDSFEQSISKKSKPELSVEETFGKVVPKKTTPDISDGTLEQNNEINKTNRAEQ